jgi:hypothetical protein
MVVLRVVRNVTLDDMKTIFCFAATALLLFSCGPSEEERARLQKSREDSINKSKSALEAATNLLIIKKADLVASSDKLNSIKQPQFLRTANEREQQIRNQVIVIQNLERDIKRLDNSIATEHRRISRLKNELVSLH